MSKEDLIFTYQGLVNEDIVGDILHLVESALKAEDIKTNVRRKIFRVILEGIQNLYKHSTDPSNETLSDKEVTTVLVRKNDHFILILGNYIVSSEVKVLKSKIDSINSQDGKELRTNYIEVLNNNKRTKDGGSGLGLMDIARKSGQPLTYEFDDLNDGLSYFKLIVKINKDG